MLDLLSGVSPALAFEPYGFGKTLGTVELAQNTHQLFEIFFIDKTIDTVSFTQLTIPFDARYLGSFLR